jgi:hypothetical protein
VIWGSIVEVAEIDLKIAPRELTLSGDLATRTDPSGIERPLTASYQARISLDEHDQRLLAGAAGRARIHVDKQTLLRRTYQYLSRTFRFDF